jgi:hypothetical protein
VTAGTDHWHGFEAMALIEQHSRVSLHADIGHAAARACDWARFSRTCAAEAESVPIQDLNKGDPNKGCAGENSYLRNGTCWQRVITDPRFKSYEDHVTCRKADGTVEIRISARPSEPASLVRFTFEDGRIFQAIVAGEPAHQRPARPIVEHPADIFPRDPGHRG